MPNYQGVWSLSEQYQNASGWPDATAGTAVFGGGVDASGRSTVIQFVSLESAGNTSDFGDLTAERTGFGGFSSATRGVFAGGDGSGGSSSNVIDFITFSSAGNATDFGDLLAANQQCNSCSNDTRGLVSGGFVSSARTDVTLDQILLTM